MQGAGVRDAGQKGVSQACEHLRVGEGRREQLQRVREADGRPARDEVPRGARLSHVPPVHAPQHLRAPDRLRLLGVAPHGLF